jgi:hypothetical protein
MAIYYKTEGNLLLSFFIRQLKLTAIEFKTDGNRLLIINHKL